MEEFSKWILCITLAGLASSLLYILIPRGAMEKTFKTVTSIFIIAVISAPAAAVINNGIKLKAPSFSYNDNSEQYAALVSRQMLSAADTAAKSAVIKTIPQLETQAKCITANAETDDDNYLRINSITVVLYADSTVVEAEAAVRLTAALEIPVEVIKDE